MAPGLGVKPPAWVISSQGRQYTLERGTSQPDNFSCLSMKTTTGPEARVVLAMTHSRKKSGTHCTPLNILSSFHIAVFACNGGIPYSPSQ